MRKPQPLSSSVLRKSLKLKNQSNIMNEFTTKLETIKTEAQELTDTVDRLIREVQNLKPEARSKELERKRHRLEMELLNMRDFMWIRRG
jgi:hypothetical protein